MSRIKDIPNSEKPREKALFYGLGSLSNAELLAILISSGTKNHSALEVGYELLAKFNGIEGIINAPINDLTKVDGINKVKALKLKAAFTLYERSLEEKNCNNFSIKGRDNIAIFFRDKLSRLVQEKAFVVVVDGKNNVKTIREVFRGTSHKLTISPRMIIQNVIDRGNRFYVIHNHPSNICVPSDEDRMSTSEIEILSYSFGIQLVDHLIITKDKYYSIIENKEKEYIELSHN